MATALLGTLLVSVLLADGRVRHQTKRAELRTEACEIADGLLAKWWKKKDTFPRNDAGPAKGHVGWRWRTRVVANPRAEDLGGEVIVLEVFAPEEIGAGESEPAVGIEILLPAIHEDEDE